MALASIASPPLAGEKEGSEGKVAVVNGAVITQSDFNMEMHRILRQFATLGRSLLWQKEL